MPSYLNKNVNLALLIIIIGVVVALVGTTVFFQRSLQNRTISLEDTYDNLDSCNAALNNYVGKYSEAAQQVNETAQDIRKYDQLYESKVGELEDTQDQLLESETQLAFERQQKESFQQQYEDALSDITTLELTIASNEELIDDLGDEINELEADLAACGS